MTAGAPWRGRELPWLALLPLLWLAATAWLRPLALPDEGRYVGVAWEMLRSGDWLTPTLNGLPYFHKPPLFYWITAGSLSLFGLTEWAARAAPICGAWLGAVATLLFVRRWWGQRAARLALLALLVQPLYFGGAQFANLDMLVAGCITATTMLLADAALCIERGLPHRSALVSAYAMAALGVLAKGLIGFVIPALVVGAWLLVSRRWRVLVPLMSWRGSVVFIALAAPWFVAMQLRFADFIDYFFVVQHFRRFAAGGFNNVQPFWFFPVLLLLLTLPWWPWLVGPIKRALGNDIDHERGQVRLLSVLWVAIIVAFFSLPQSKLVGYVLPAVPPLALLMADGYLSLAAPSSRAKRLWQASTTLGALLSVAAVVAFALQPAPSSRAFASLLATQRAPHEPVIMLGAYFFDLPFYAGIREPLLVVDEWASAEVGQRDNWRKELAEAARFAPARAAASLLLPISLAARLCAAPVSWVIGPSGSGQRYPFMFAARVALSQRDTVLWRVDRSQSSVISALGCEQTPSDGSADK